MLNMRNPCSCLRISKAKRAIPTKDKADWYKVCVVIELKTQLLKSLFLLSVQGKPVDHRYQTVEGCVDQKFSARGIAQHINLHML